MYRFMEKPLGPCLEHKNSICTTSSPCRFCYYYNFPFPPPKLPVCKMEPEKSDPSFLLENQEEKVGLPCPQGDENLPTAPPPNTIPFGGPGFNI